jgi:acid phosphatase
MQYFSVFGLCLLALATAQEVPTRSPVTHVKGKQFNRFVTIWLENTDYDKAAGDPNLKWLATQGITLSNYFGVTHPSMGNYVAAVAGDYFGINHDDYLEIPKNISTIADVLDAGKISWGEYQEDMPYTGYTPFEWVNPQTKANMYVRKHNPLVIFDSVSTNKERLGLIKNTTVFWEDVKNEKLPQWMFITPNMTSDGHDSSVTVAGKWTRDFLTPLLSNSYFMKDTLILVTFDENHTYASQNRVFSILLGGAVDKSLHGTTDDNYYNHYSEISTVCANWGLPTLGRWDVGANVFSIVAKKTGDEVRINPELHNTYLNISYPGPWNHKTWAPHPAPNVSLVINDLEVLRSIQEEFKDGGMTYYENTVEVPSGANPPVLVEESGPSHENHGKHGSNGTGNFSNNHNNPDNKNPANAAGTITAFMPVVFATVVLGWLL